MVERNSMGCCGHKRGGAYEKAKKAPPPKHYGNDDNWIQQVEKEMEKDGTEGAFTRQAKRAGKSVHDFAKEVVAKYKGKEGLTKHQETLLKRAVLALNFEKMRKKKK